MEHPMLYSKIYESIVERAKNRILTEYSEKHHILPKCLGGTDESDNLVRLTFREHFLCHQLLCKIYPENKKLLYAFSSMVRVSLTNHKRNDVLTSRHFDLVKKTLAPYIGKWNIGKTPWNKGIIGDAYKSKYKSGLTPPRHDGARWINDGVHSKKIQKEVPLPEGYVYGRLSMQGENNPMKDKMVAAKNTELRKKK
jgi:hypothetical protein